MAAKSNYRKWVWGAHLLFWVLILVIQYLFFHLVLSDHYQVASILLVNLSGFLLLVYVHLLYLLPKFFDTGKYWRYGLLTLVLLLITGAWRFYVGWEIIEWMDWVSSMAKFKPSYSGGVFFGGTFLLLLSIPLRLIENWFKKRELEKELKTHQLEAELRFLKAQVNPHFLFNALNNIYSLSFTESKKTPEMILKLSDMMSYMLYDCKNEQVKLSSEIGYLKNYIALQQLKKDGEFNICFKTSDNTSTVMITPMLFIPFFENAFKHGNLEDIKNGWLESELKVENGILEFNISNTVGVHKKNKKGKGGVGLENIRDRLRLLFPEKHKLKIKKEEGLFSVNLIIELN